MMEPTRSFEGLLDLATRLMNILRMGVIHQADYDKPRVKVKIGESESGQPLLTDWLPFFSNRAGNDREWHPPEVGEQVMVLSPNGELNTGAVLPAIFQEAFAANSNSPDIHRKDYQDGTVVEYNRKTHKLKVDCVGSVEVNGAQNLDVNFDGQVEVNAPTTIINTEQTHNGNMVLNGNLVVSENLTVAKMATVGGLASAGAYGGAGATIDGDVKVQNGDIDADGVTVKGHHHDDSLGAPTSPAKA
ncbi:phage baseplate assembly protein V [Hydrogenovibrio sp. 3SP14C1]|uniref:phage baseplate assembly protein V n=1 Tax=Hydrogenovibrio sp. 3SP14C1 TaxID=3038774 RepID=UPI0024169D50|nr:phage baseplate assembly protein V [Hydrogenovibrio sp. 3SP14C1]MDG4811658.1 phage baseplate assembly protein V [Hydrogenovibrio sp. 3SP14C1]